MLTQAQVRRRRVGGALMLVIGLALLAVAGLAITGQLGATAPNSGVSDAAASAGATSGSASASADPSASATETSTPPAPTEPTFAPLAVINASDVGGLAGQSADFFQEAGWEIQETGNLTGANVPESSTVFYPAGDSQAQAAALYLVSQYPQLTADQAPSNFEYTGVVVVLTGDWIPGQ